MKYLLDTNILIYALANLPAAKNFVTTHLAHCALSQVTYIEILSSPRIIGEEEHRIRLFLSTLRTLPITDDIAEQAIQNRRAHRIKLPDNLIAATAQVHKLTLVTRNLRDFQALDNLKLHNPFDHV